MVINDGKNYFFAKVVKVEWWEYIFSKDQKLKSFHFLVFSVFFLFFAIPETFWHYTVTQQIFLPWCKNIVLDMH